MKWSVNPLLAPHFGGVYEAMVKSAERALFANLNNTDIKDEELHSAIVALEYLINYRPLVHPSSSVKDDTPLAPNYFLIGTAGQLFVATACDNHRPSYISALKTYAKYKSPKVKNNYIR